MCCPCESSVQYYSQVFDGSRPLNVIGNMCCLCKYVNVIRVDFPGFMQIRHLEVHKSTSFKYICSWVAVSNSKVFHLNSATGIVLCRGNSCV